MLYAPDGPICQQDILLTGNQLHQVRKNCAVLTLLIEVVKYFLGAVILIVSENLLFLRFIGCHKSAHPNFLKILPLLVILEPYAE